VIICFLYLGDKNLKIIEPNAKPFIKWAGGKRSILSTLQSQIPEQYDSYYEVFLGGGALFFSLNPNISYLADYNSRLINAYTSIRDNLDIIIMLLKVHNFHHSKEYYLDCRRLFNIETDPDIIAALFIYLNKTCFNGLYRVNKSNGFNVPMGNYSNPNILDTENLIKVSKALKGTTIVNQSFHNTPITKNSFYYLDPPYHGTFDAYSKEGFNDTHHIELSQLCKKIHNEGSYFMLSNSNTPFVRELYSDYNIKDVKSIRTISCNVKSRGKENECLITNY
jgi:DNA adenine methylase